LKISSHLFCKNRISDHGGINLLAPPPVRPPWWRRKRLGAALLAAGGVLLAFELSGGFSDTKPQAPPPPTPPGLEEKKIRSLEAANSRLRSKIAAFAPKGTYLVIDTAGNRVFLRKGEETIREMVASCGSGNVLEDPVGGRKWVFDTPRGEFKVQSKIAKPIWIKPDWAFLEEGEPIPTNPAKRAERGVMGDYAIGIGRGYFIHGTLYTRLLGRNVSHGCVRLGDKDLKDLYDTTAMGTRVIIF
jgi:L,D-transpeptidase YbiS